MVSVAYNKNLLIRVRHNWYLYEPGNFKEEFVWYHGVNDTNIFPNKQYMVINKQFSLISDLKEPDDVLMSKISKNYRHEIRRCLKEEIQCKTLLADELKASSLLDCMIDTYNSMYHAKNIKKTFNKKQILTYISKQAVVCTVGFLEQSPVAFHLYIVNGENTRLLYSTSSFRANREESEKIGRINKYLHWYDFSELRKLGYISYDWGGISNPDQPCGIDEFKMRFGGDLVEYYNVLLLQGLAGKLYYHLRKRIYEKDKP